MKLRDYFWKALTVMATTVSILCAVICVLAIIYAFIAYRDTRKYNSKIKKEQRSKPKPRY
jgi:polyferredoxin